MHILSFVFYLNPIHEIMSASRRKTLIKNTHFHTIAEFLIVTFITKLKDHEEGGVLG